MKRCDNCKYWSPLKDNHKQGECIHPEREDKKLVHYFGSLKCTDYCALHDTKESADGRD